MSVIKQRWKDIGLGRPEGYFTNLFGNVKERESNDFCLKNLGTFFYGHYGDYRYTRHIGTTWRMAEWQRVNGKPGGSPHWDLISLKQRAPWLPEIEARPVNPVELTKDAKEEIKKHPKKLVEKFVKGLK
jgi:nitrate reductase alpha subunit